jgi:dihydropteroate synthase
MSPSDPSETPELSAGAAWPLPARPYPYVMGILNVTPDSFSDGGRYVDVEKALAHVNRMVADGADIIDIGAESTRPYDGQKPVSAEEEIRRLEPILPHLASFGVPVSIDTMKAKVARIAIDGGAAIINDVQGLQGDPDMARIAADTGVPVIAMHNRDTVDATIDIMADISEFFVRTIDIAEKAGISRDKIVLDPGIGFGKTPEQSMQVLARLAELTQYGFPILVGASRKRFIASVTPSEPEQRLGGSLAAHLLAALNGAAIIRTHDVYDTVQALRIASAIEGER